MKGTKYDIKIFLQVKFHNKLSHLSMKKQNKTKQTSLIYFLWLRMVYRLKYE